MVKNQLPRFPSTQEVKKEFQAWLNQPVTAHFENLWLHNRNGTEEHKSKHTGAYKNLTAYFKATRALQNGKRAKSGNGAISAVSFEAQQIFGEALTEQLNDIIPLTFVRLDELDTSMVSDSALKFILNAWSEQLARTESAPCSLIDPYQALRSTGLGESITPRRHEQYRMYQWLKTWVEKEYPGPTPGQVAWCAAESSQEGLHGRKETWMKRYVYS